MLSFLLLFASDSQVADKIVVNKSKHELLLFREGKLLKSYRVALGGNPVGRKERQGDRRTPEGTYTITEHNPASAYHRSLRISYPNDADRARAKRLGVNPGGDIMIHGLPNGEGFLGAAHRLTDWTDGCIAVTNSDIEEIRNLAPNGTPIQINP